MKKYKRRSSVVEAIQWDKKGQTLSYLQRKFPSKVKWDSNRGLLIKAFEGEKVVKYKDFIVIGHSGYPFILNEATFNFKFEEL